MLLSLTAGSFTKNSSPPSNGVNIKSSAESTLSIVAFIKKSVDGFLVSSLLTGIPHFVEPLA